MCKDNDEFIDINEYKLLIKSIQPIYNEQDIENQFLLDANFIDDETDEKQMAYYDFNKHIIKTNIINEKIVYNYLNINHLNEINDQFDYIRQEMDFLLNNLENLIINLP